MANKIGRFEIVSKVAQSAFATVYKALDTENQQTIALKVVPLKNVLERDSLIKTVFEEADRSKPLNSHNIAGLYGVGDEEGQLLAGAEYVQGNSVATTLARKDSFSIWDLQDIARQVCQALDHAHVHKVAHHSLEPAKIMVQWDGTVKVLGFGISSMNSLAGTLSTVPEILHYVSPELLRGEACDHRSALFALGAILYEMATEQKAFAGETAEQVRAAILEGMPPLPHRIKPNLSQGLSALIMKAISKSLANRYQSGLELLRDLEQCNSTTKKTTTVAPSVVKAQAAAAAAVSKPAVTAKPAASAPTATVAKPAGVQASAPAPVVGSRPAPSAAPAGPKAATTVPGTTAKPAVPAKPSPSAKSPSASAAAPATKPAASKPNFAVDPMMAEHAEGAAAAPRRSFSELEELPPLKEMFVPAPAPPPVSTPEQTEPIPPVLQALKNKKLAAEKPPLQVREGAQKAVTELRNTPPKLYLYAFGAAIFLIALILSGMALRNFIADHEGRASSASSAPAKAAPGKPTPPAAAASTAPAPVQSQPAQLEPPQSEPAPTVQEQPEKLTGSNPKTGSRERPRSAVPLLAKLTVSSFPEGAQISFDGSPLCQSPCTLTDIAPGEHIVSATKSGFNSATRTIKLKEGASTTIALQLPTLAASLTVSSTPAGAAIIIDGQDTGRLTPTVFTVNKPGIHSVAIRRIGYLESSSSMNIQIGQSASLNPTLTKLGNTDDIHSAGGKFKKVFGHGGESGMGVVSIKTQPKGAQIMVNNRVLDKTAPFDFYLNPGAYVIDITLAGHRSIRRVINVAEGEKVAIEETLAPQ